MQAASSCFPGINREARRRARASPGSGAEPAIVWHADHELPPGTDLVVLPGGFSYGDYLRCGAIAARSPIMRAVGEHAARGGLVLGVCNGFQILCEAGLLPGVLDAQFAAPLRLPDAAPAGRERADSVHARYAPGQVVKFAIAHGEGNFDADEETIRGIEAEGPGRVSLLRRGGGRRRRVEPERGHQSESPGCSTTGSMCSA